MEQLISRRLPARRAQSGVALIMVLIMLTAMAIAGVALVRVVDSANVISGNFAFRQSTLNIADLGVEAAVVDLEFNIPAAAKGAPWPVGCAADCRYFPVRSINLPNLNCGNPPFPQGCGLDGKGLPVRGNTTAITDPPQQDIGWNGNDVAGAPRGYAIRYVIDRQCNQAFPGVANPPLDACSNDTPLTPVSKKAGGGGLPAPDGIIFYRVTVQVTGPRNTQSHVQVFLSY
jgi:type IV pilus assembly protein PilX